MIDTTKSLDKEIINKPINSWPDFAKNFLFQFFEGKSFAIWLFVSTLLIIVYANFSNFKNDPYGDILHAVSLLFLSLLIGLILVKNLLFVELWNIGDRIRSLTGKSVSFKVNRWVANVFRAESQKLDLPIKVINFKRIYSKIKILNAGDGRWRAGFVFNSKNGKREYIFHSYQDKGQPEFRIRIVAREPNVREILGDINNQINVGNPHSFESWVESKGDKLAFYIDGVLAGKYKVPLKTIISVQVAAWSDAKPIKVLFEDIEIQS